jgi:hypothetical protein
MAGRFRGWLMTPRERRPRSRLSGCLLWILALIVVLIILSLLFGGFRKGTKATGASPPPVTSTSAGLPIAQGSGTMAARR